MALDPVVNFFRSEIATLPLASGGTSMVITTGDGNKLPNPAVDGAFNLTIYNASDPFVTPEIVRCTAKSGDTLTITRAQEGTTATNKTSGSTWYVELTPTAKTIQDIDSAKLDKAGGTMTGDLTIPDKIIHAGDTNTAIRFPANDTVAVETNGTEKIRATSTAVVVNESGLDQDFRVEGDTLANLVFVDASTDRVGINTATPATLLDVNGDVTITDKIIHSGDTNTAIRFPSADTFTIETGGTEAVRVNSSQNVGIKTTSPSQPLHVTGNSFLDGTLILPANSRIFTKSVTLADATDTTLLTITAPGSGAQIQTSLLIFVSLEGRWDGIARATGSALYHYTYVKVTGANKATSLQDIKALNFVTENASLINLSSHSFTDNNVDATTNTISATFTSSGSNTRTFVARVTVLIQGATPAIIT